MCVAHAQKAESSRAGVEAPIPAAATEEGCGWEGILLLNFQPYTDTPFSTKETSLGSFFKKNFDSFGEKRTTSC